MMNKKFEEGETREQEKEEDEREKRRNRGVMLLLTSHSSFFVEGSIFRKM